MLQFAASLTDDTRSVNYDRNTFIIQATDLFVSLVLLIAVKRSLGRPVLVAGT
jgi:hypothetical protein